MARFDARLFWAFYSLIDVPRDEHRHVLSRMGSRLKPGEIFAAAELPIPGDSLRVFLLGSGSPAEHPDPSSFDRIDEQVVERVTPGDNQPEVSCLISWSAHYTACAASSADGSTTPCTMSPRYSTITRFHAAQTSSPVSVSIGSSGPCASSIRRSARFHFPASKVARKVLGRITR
jgi:hypothetical protein